MMKVVARKTKKSSRSYVGKPKVPPEAKKRFEAVTAVIAEQMTMNEAAEYCGLSRVQMQTLVHRAEQGVIEAVQPQRPGRKPSDPEKKELRGDLERLQRRVEHQAQKLDILEASREVLIDELQAQIGRSREPGRHRSRSRRPKGQTKGDKDDDDAHRRLRRAEELLTAKASKRIAAASVGTTVATLRRWAARRNRGEPLRHRPGPGPQPPSPEVVRRVENELERCAMMAGGETLSKRIPEVSRRQAQAIRADMARRNERERKKRALRLTVLVPGVLRGFDALHLVERESLALIAQDRCTRLVTSLTESGSYDSENVVYALRYDWERAGSPWVLVLDNAKSHRSESVAKLAIEYGVQLVFSPPYYPAFNGGLERGNRDYRELERRRPGLEPAAYCTFLNERVPRLTLDGCTPVEFARANRRSAPPRAAFQERVAEYRERLRSARSGDAEALSEDQLVRIAVTRSLVDLEVLTINQGGWG